MTDTDRLQALTDLFLAGSRITDGARKVAGLVLSGMYGGYRQTDVCSVYGVNRSTACRWIAEARKACIIQDRGSLMCMSDVDIEWLRELAHR